MSRDLSEKGWVPLRHWALWWTLLALAMVVFYVVADADLDRDQGRRLAGGQALVARSRWVSSGAASVWHCVWHSA